MSSLTAFAQQRSECPFFLGKREQLSAPSALGLETLRVQIKRLERAWGIGLEPPCPVNPRGQMSDEASPRAVGYLCLLRTPDLPLERIAK